MPKSVRLGVCVFLIGTIAVLSASAYEYPLSTEVIRRALLWGRGSDSADANFLDEYRHALPKLRVGAYTSVIAIETPFVQIANRARTNPNYEASDAIKEFVGKQNFLRVHLDICYSHKAPEPIKIKITQNDKQLTPASEKREAYYPFQDQYLTAPSIGEHVQIELSADEIDSSRLTIEIDTPTGQQAATAFNLAELR